MSKDDLDLLWRIVYDILKDLKEELPRVLDEKLRSVWVWRSLPREERLKFKCCGSCRKFLTPECPYYRFNCVLETDPPCMDYERKEG
ncbi:hypothetical protein DRO69_02180 [Candidatus Bathyarchaeota archaeon]|nr:MAG: hypothetical protein DRO69_02180 [Candidatus Bathyarchaeota archaeon]